MSAIDKVNRIVDLMNEIQDIMQELKTENDVHVLSVDVRDEGKKNIHIFEDKRFVEVYKSYDVLAFSDKSDALNVEIEGVNIFTLIPKGMEETA